VTSLSEVIGAGCLLLSQPSRMYHPCSKPCAHTTTLTHLTRSHTLTPAHRGELEVSQAQVVTLSEELSALQAELASVMEDRYQTQVG
jgi:hypothetical protein